MKRQFRNNETNPHHREWWAAVLFIAAEKRTLNLAEPVPVSGSEHLICVIFDILYVNMWRISQMLLRLELKIPGSLDQVFIPASYCLLVHRQQKFTFLLSQQVHYQQEETFYFLHLPWKIRSRAGWAPVWILQKATINFQMHFLWFEHHKKALFCKSHLCIWIILSLVFILTLHIFIRDGL